MSDHMLPQCGERFDNIHQRLSRMDGKLDRLCEAVLGNGDPGDSLASRIARIETAGEVRRQTADRSWKVIAVIASLLALAISAYQTLAR